MPTKGEGEDGNSACHEHQIVPSTLLFDKVHIQRGSCWLSCEILASIATIACGNNGWVPSLSLIKATWVRQAPPASPAMPSRVAAQKEAPFASSSLEQRHKGFVQVDAEWLLASRLSRSTAVVQLPDCMGLVL